jgi:hypothetical protein
MSKHPFHELAKIGQDYYIGLLQGEDRLTAWSDRVLSLMPATEVQIPPIRSGGLRFHLSFGTN